MSRRDFRGPSPIAADQGHVGAGTQTDAAVGVTSSLLAGPLTFGLIGYGLDRWFGTRVLVALGILFGLAISLYIVWLRYGPEARPGGRPDNERPRHPRSAATPTTPEENQ